MVHLLSDAVAVVAAQLNDGIIVSSNQFTILFLVIGLTDYI